MLLQTDPGWLPERIGRATASRMKDALAKTKSGWGAERMKYAIELVTERVTGLSVERFVTEDMKRGTRLEPVARDLYEVQTGDLVGPAGLVHHPEIEWFSATPDGFLGRDGLIEIKVPRPERFMAWRMAGEVPDEHVVQMLSQLACTRRKWVEFAAFCDLVPREKQLFIVRFEPPNSAIEEVEHGAREFLAMVDKMFEQFTEAE